MKRTVIMDGVARGALGLLFGVSGFCKLIGVAMPPPPGAATLFLDGLVQSGYFIPLLGMVEIGAASLLAFPRAVPLALLLLAPIALNIAFFHLLLAPAGIPVVVVIAAAGGFLASRRRAAFAGVLQARPAPASARLRALELAMGVAFIASAAGFALDRLPPPSSAGAAALMAGFAAARYFLPLLCIAQFGAGVLLVVRRHVPLALLVLAPIVVEIFAYRLYVAAVSPRMLVVALGLIYAEIGLVLLHRTSFAALLRPEHTRPGLAPAQAAMAVGLDVSGAR